MTTENPDNLIVVNEGNRLKRYSEVIHKYSEVQGSIEASVKVPNLPIESSVAADTHRHSSYTQIIEGTTVATRTIGFRVSLPSDCTEFENDLDKWVRERGSKEGGKYQETTNSDCREFLVAHGGITHYVSSITLGAMKYRTKTTKSKTVSYSGKAGLSTERFGSMKAGVSRRKTNLHDEEKYESIGSIGEDKKVPLRSPSEAVISYAFTPVTNLVSNEDLRHFLQQAMQQYIQATIKSE